MAMTMSSDGRRGFWQTLCAGSDAWSREARRVHELAARRGVRLDEQTLIFSDVRDLQALEWRLAHSRHVSAHS